MKSAGLPSCDEPSVESCVTSSFSVESEHIWRMHAVSKRNSGVRSDRYDPVKDLGTHSELQTAEEKQRH